LRPRVAIVHCLKLVLRQLRHQAKRDSGIVNPHFGFDGDQRVKEQGEVVRMSLKPARRTPMI